ncbi:hypothetical protein AUK40_00565 [Candidatus Wirthbacteria bacterium CG2_30_54_11]|uniref:Peptidase A2 domain-containing protein n=1 Tax=Candidatus Wirthbacteria bacterium CG2_30_54_11 TaxID=1817892 RepID=A0A1J5J2S9_9BACT|nr:MAG: hypothetical protein AUK40_00565 [Candidatus Wirthbacteria bacterium CG2_30_54_11]
MKKFLSLFAPLFVIVFMGLTWSELSRINHQQQTLLEDVTELSQTSSPELEQVNSSLRSLGSDVGALKEQLQVISQETLSTLTSTEWQTNGDLSFLTSFGFIEVPILRKSNYYEVRVQINGQNAYLLLDTGASQSTLDLTRSERFNATSHPSTAEREFVGIGGSSMTTVRYTLDTLTIDAIELKKVDISAIDLQALNDSLEKVGAYPIDGLLGDDLLSPNDGIIDYAHEKLYLRK